ncbi:ankyrin repeat domain-containing protein [Brevibacillus sp. NRS-1366]|uniref:ankyrin repeat domain-containing protein n=1 Tax=Brevibacillus sp. NRS-1366 TaxID=3233899 RepID=UPI003D226083
MEAKSIENSIRSQVVQIFEYLLAVKNMNEKVIRSVRDYEEVWWQKDFPNVEGCYLNGTGVNQEAWLEVHKQEVPPAPALPTVLSGWVMNWDNPDKEPEITRTRLNKTSDGEEKELLEDNQQRLLALKDWLQKWRNWAPDASIKKKIQALYMSFFSLYQRFQREGDTIELAWGHGTLLWNVNGENIERPLLVTRQELIFDAKRGIFSLIPTSRGTWLEIDMLNNLDIPHIKRLQTMERQVEETNLDPLEKDSTIVFLKEIVHTIHPDGKYVEREENAKNSSIPVIMYNPCIFLRNSGGRLWQNELTQAIEKIKEGYSVPGTIKSLATIDTDTMKQVDELDGEWKNVGEDLLFPLPANQEQKLISQLLATNDGVVVQGPPGTGKSHTIANLISHLLAHGKRILVTSEKEHALKVLRDKIPAEIQSLCVSLLGGDSRSIKEVEDSIKNIAENLDSKQPDLLRKNIERLESELKEARKNIAKYQTFLNHAAERENQIIQIGDFHANPMELAKWVKENEVHSWLPDAIEITDECPLALEEMENFFQLANRLNQSDIDRLQLSRPKVAELPTLKDFEDYVEAFNSIDKQLAESTKYLDGWNLPDVIPPEHKHVRSEVTQLLDKRGGFQEEWQLSILRELETKENKRSTWREFVEENEQRLARLQDIHKSLLEFEHVLPASYHPTTLQEDLMILKNELQGKKGFSWIFKNVTGRKYVYILDGCKVNGLPIRQVEDIDVLLKVLERDELKTKISLKWNRTMEEIDGEKLEAAHSRFVSHLENTLEELSSLLAWFDNVSTLLKPYAEQFGFPIPMKWTDSGYLEKVKLGLQAIDIQERWKHASTVFANLTTLLDAERTNTQADSSWETLYRACEQKDVTSWVAEYKEIVRLESLEISFQQFRSFKQKLESVVPLWINQIISEKRTGKTVALPPDWELAWRWSKANRWLNDLHAMNNVDELQEVIDREKKVESRIIKDLVAESTWLAQLERTTDEQKRSLHAWVKAIQKIGKGTGKYVDVYRKEASKEMKVCKGAIPVWIMPIQKVIENLQLSNEMFDVVIVDESSQSNLFSLSALLRGKKAVIVGDDNQISPESVGTDLSEIHKLIQRHLSSIPNSQSFEITTSLYDITNQVFSGKVVLKEHFRCVPEIIQFSNDLMYGGKIDPLRLPLSHERFKEPVKAIRVAEGYRDENTRKIINVPEAEAIVNYVKELIRNDRYDGKSIGIISLQAQDQAKYLENLLREKIGEEEMISRRLICGDAYSFQGDERDVIILSMVAAPNVGIGALVKRSDYQRFNVAASRARDQMILFHSVDLNHLNPQCARFRLLQYCLHPHRVNLEVEHAKDLLESPFEEDVYRLIAARGYRVIPQVKVGSVNKRIDLVIEGMSNRLAVECDGDKWHGLDKWEDDLERQRILERVGWNFWRIRGSVFYRDPEKAMASLWRRLDEMGIMPKTYSQVVFEEQIQVEKVDKTDAIVQLVQTLQQVKEVRFYPQRTTENLAVTEEIEDLNHSELEGPFIEAIEEGNLSLVQILLREGCNPNSKNGSGEPVLSIAIEYGYFEIALELMKKGANANIVNQYGTPILLSVIEYGEEELVGHLLANGADPNLTDKYGQTPLMEALDYDNYEIARLLLQHRADPNKRAKYSTPIEYAVQQNDADLLKLLLDHGATVHEENASILIDAVEEEDIDMVKVILESKGNPNGKDTYGNTALHLAVERDNEEIVRALLQAGANPNMTDNYEKTPLGVAIDYASEELVKILLKHGANPNLKSSNEYLLINAIEEEKEEVIKDLLAHKANPNVTDNYGNPALELAIERGNMDITKELLASNIELNLKNKYGKTALCVAVENEEREFARMLLKKGADPNVGESSTDYYPLRFALDNGDTSLINLLLDHGAKHYLINSYHWMDHEHLLKKRGLKS